MTDLRHIMIIIIIIIIIMLKQGQEIVISSIWDTWSVLYLRMWHCACSILKMDVNIRKM